MRPIHFFLREGSRPQPHTASLSWEEGLLQISVGLIRLHVLSWTNHWAQDRILELENGVGSQANHMAEDERRVIPWRGLEILLPGARWMDASSKCRCYLEALRAHDFLFASHFLGCYEPFLAAFHTCGNVVSWSSWFKSHVQWPLSKSSADSTQGRW